ncbi:hypothetical protein GF373_09325 [bacterium]|nr:hypothetical protein [bacterium]
MKGNTSMRYIVTISLLYLMALQGLTREYAPVWTIHDLDRRSSVSTNDKIVGTHYFYWYDYPHQHFFDNAARTDDALQDHFPNPESVSYRSAAWHKQEMRDCEAAGLDFIMPVYWGVPDNYFKQGTAFSVQGLAPLQRAIEERAREGKSSPKIGLFFDTSTLLPGVRGELGNREKYDLRKPKGQDIFYRTIRDFFDQIHPKHWMCINGRPLVVLYGSGFAKYQDQSVFDYTYEQFQADFHGIKPYIIRDHSWYAHTDGTTRWGAALSGPKIFNHVAQVGPGYNDMAVPGRSTPIRQRENGNFYRWGWNQILQSAAKIVLVETWNEMHEGTDICHSREFGRQYIQLTKKYVEMFKRGEQSEKKIELQYKNPVPRPTSDRGGEYKDEKEVSIILGNDGKSRGIWLVRGQTDGPVRNDEIAGEPSTRTSDAGNTYMYFNIADPFLFNTEKPIPITYTYYDDGFDHHILQYDSHDENATLNGAYKDLSPVKCGNTKEWKTIKATIPDARFVNRQNGGSDFRFAVRNGYLAIRSIHVDKFTW